MGLLYGILESYQKICSCEQQQQQQEQERRSSRSPLPPSPPPISIAVIERGTIVGPSTSNAGDDTSTTCERSSSLSTSSSSVTTSSSRRRKDNLSSSLLLKPSHWYKAAHSMHHEYVTHYPLQLYGNRITELPIGTGLGGTSLINACLCMSPPVQQQEQLTQQTQHKTTTTTTTMMKEKSTKKTTTPSFVPGDEFKMWSEPWKTYLPNVWIPYIQNIIECNGHLYHYTTGVPSSIPYHYNYNYTNNKNDDELSKSSLSSSSSSPSSSSQQPPSVSSSASDLYQFQIDKKGTPTLLRQVVGEENHTARSKSSDQQPEDLHQAEFVRSTYYDALIEPYLVKYPSLAKCITWFGSTQVERLLSQSTTTTNNKSNRRSNNEQLSSSPTTATTTSSYGSGGAGSGFKRVVIGVEVSTYSSSCRGTRKRSSGDGCCNATNHEYFHIYARQDVILCAGAIETPALLLLDQLEMKRLYQRENEIFRTSLNESKLHPNNEGPSTPEFQSSKCFFALRGVGRNLRDQVILPRAYLTPPSVWGERSRATSSPNGIAFTGYLTPRRCESEHDSTLHAETNVFQVAVTDSTGQSFTMPSLVAMALRRGRRHKDERRSAIAVNILFEGLFVLAKSLLYLALTCTPLGWLLQHCTTTTLLILLFPCSTGSVRIVTCEPSSAITGNPGDNQRKEFKKDSQLTNRTAQEQSRPWRRHMVELDIDVGYLRDAKDLESLKRGWDACSQLVRTNFVSVFPPSFWKITETSWWKLFCCSFSLPYYHFMGTCAMRMPGLELQIDRSYKINATSSDESKRFDNSEDWVVHPDLCVRNYAGLRVCDASVIPTMISSPPALTLSAIGYGLGKTLIEKFLKDKMV